MEDYAWVVEYLPSGRSEDMRKEPLAQLVGHQFFTLLEASVKPQASVLVGTKIFVGKGEREQIDRIKRRITYNDLTNGAKEILSNVVKRIVDEREELFVNFLNKAGPISMRVHQMDLLPGIGKRNMEELLKEREKEPFKSFADIKERVHTVPDPAGVFVHRIISELEGKERYFLFTKPPQRPY
jgi:putative nucleotide binding protein